MDGDWALVTTDCSRSDDRLNVSETVCLMMDPQGRLNTHYIKKRLGWVFFNLIIGRKEKREKEGVIERDCE